MFAGATIVPIELVYYWRLFSNIYNPPPQPAWFDPATKHDRMGAKLDRFRKKRAAKRLV